MLLVYIAADMDNSNAIPGVIMIGAFTVPFSALVFFFEMNTYRNISFYEVLKVFFLGCLIFICHAISISICILFGSKSSLWHDDMVRHDFCWDS